MSVVLDVEQHVTTPVRTPKLGSSNLLAVKFGSIPTYNESIPHHPRVLKVNLRGLHIPSVATNNVVVAVKPSETTFVLCLEFGIVQRKFISPPVSPLRLNPQSI